MKVFAALENDVSTGLVWLAKTGGGPRCVIRITNPSAGLAVYCEALIFEKNFLAKYNQPPRVSIADQASSIVMGGWYRARLGGLETQKDYPLQITPCDGSWGKLRACIDHPQIVVRVAAWLGIVSVCLGFVGVILGAASVWPHG
jgi:hypothetical protein